MDGRDRYLRPSAAATWLQCFGYAALCNNMGAAFSEKDEGTGDNEVREDGTACHWLAEQVQIGSVVPIGAYSPNNRAITLEMQEAVELYMECRDESLTWNVEQSQPVSVMFPNVQDGTPDRWAYDVERRVLYVDDLKYGFIPVAAEWNPQLLLYAITLAVAVLKLTDPETVLTLRIIQPRAPHMDGPVRSWSVKLGDPAVGDFVARVRLAANSAMADDPMCKTSSKCARCAARVGCKAFVSEAMTAIETIGDARPTNLTPPQLGYYLQQLDMAADRALQMAEALETEIEWQLRKGVVFPGYTMSSRAGNRQWTIGVEEVSRLATLFGKPLVKPKAVTPRQAELAGVPESVVNMYAERKQGQAKLTRIDKDEITRAFTKGNMK